MSSYQPSRSGKRDHRTPFLYAVGWPELDAYYVGVRYARGCHPDDLWSIYFTSSYLVQGLAAQFGPPPLIEILATYSTPEAALAAEKDAIKSFDLVGHHSFLNQWAGHGEPLTPEQLVQRGKAISAQAKTPGASERRSLANQRKFADPVITGKLSAKAKVRWEGDHAFREAAIERLRAQSSDPVLKAARDEANRASWTPERRQQHLIGCQVRGAKRAHRFDCDGEMLTIKEMSARSGVKTDTLKWRMSKGMTPQEAMTPSRLRKNTLS